MLTIALTTPLSVSPSSAPTPIQQILRTTARYFGIPSLPVSPILVTHGEFRDPLPLRWSDAPQSQDHRQRPAARLMN